jgi:hypothetical protein
MNYRVELGLTILVTVIGAGYFAWRAMEAEGNGRLLYGAFIIVGVIMARRAITDILAKQRRAERDGEGSDAPTEPRDGG